MIWEVVTYYLLIGVVVSSLYWAYSTMSSRFSWFDTIVLWPAFILMWPAVPLYLLYDLMFWWERRSRF
jgi:hypothetical protein